MHTQSLVADEALPSSIVKPPHLYYFSVPADA